METARELAASKVVLRLVTVANIFLPEGAEFPTGEAFRPSSEDRAEAARRGGPPYVSVWDTDRTTVEQASAFRPTKACRPYWLRVADVEAIGRDNGERRLRVIEDPLDDARPGAQGHCGIEGLERRDGESKKSYKALLDRLAQKCHSVPMK